MIRALIAWSIIGSAAVSAASVSEKGILDVLQRSLRGFPETERGRAGTGLDSKAGVAWNALLSVATDAVSEQFYKGMTAPLDQSGYETCLGNTAMTAFIMRYIESQRLHVLDSDALQGFVMYYDGTCMKKAFKDLAEEIGVSWYRFNCHRYWVSKSSTSMLESTHQVHVKELNGMLLKENMMMRAAAYKAGQEVETGADSITSIRKFVRGYIRELHGTVENDRKLEMLISEFLDKESNEDEVLEQLTDALMAESDKMNGACVKLPQFASRTVTLMEENVSTTKQQDASSYAVGERGTHACQIGVEITSKLECDQALDTLRLPKVSVQDGQPCYKDYKGNGYANGHHGAGAHFICKKETGYLFLQGLRTHGSGGLYVNRGDHYEGAEHMIYKDPEKSMWKIVSKAKKAQVLGAGPYDASAWTTCDVQTEDVCSGFSEFLQDASGTSGIQKSSGVVGRIGRTAPLDEDGYQMVLANGDNAEMSAFVNRTATSLNLAVKRPELLSPFARWYDGSCAAQSFLAIESELHSMAERPSVCGGGWVSASPSLSQWRNVFKHRRKPLP